MLLVSVHVKEKLIQPPGSRHRRDENGRRITPAQQASLDRIVQQNTVIDALRVSAVAASEREFAASEREKALIRRVSELETQVKEHKRYAPQYFWLNHSIFRCR